MRRSMSGWLSRNIHTQDNNQRTATAGVVDRVTACRDGTAFNRSMALPMLSKAVPSTSCKSRPLGVSNSCRGLRTNSSTPSASSSPRI